MLCWSLKCHPEVGLGFLPLRRKRATCTSANRGYLEYKGRTVVLRCEQKAFSVSAL